MWSLASGPTFSLSNNLLKYVGGRERQLARHAIAGDCCRYFSSLADCSLVLYVAREEQLLWDVTSIGHVHKVSCVYQDSVRSRMEVAGERVSTPEEVEQVGQVRHPCRTAFVQGGRGRALPGLCVNDLQLPTRGHVSASRIRNGHVGTFVHNWGLSFQPGSMQHVCYQTQNRSTLSAHVKGCWRPCCYVILGSVALRA